MAVTIYGANMFGTPVNGVNYDGGRVIGANSTTFTQGDPVSINGSGFLVVESSNSAIYGVVVATSTTTSSNQTVAKVTPYVQPVDLDYEWLMGTNSDLTQASIGVYYQLTGTTGAVLVDVATGAVTGTLRQVVCTGVDPNTLGGTGTGSGARQGLFKFVKITNFKMN